MNKTLVNILLGLSSLLWGTSFVFTKEIFAIEPHITVLQLLTFRIFLATAVTIPLLWVSRQLEPLRRADLKWFLLLALAEPFLYSICETSGVSRVSGSLSAVVVATIPFFVSLCNAAVYHERLRAVVLAGIQLSTVGIALIVWNGSALAENSVQLRNGLLLLGAAVAIAVLFTLILVRVAHHYRATTITAYQNLIGLCYFLPLMLCTDGSGLTTLHYSPRLILLVAVLGILCSTVAYMFYNIGVQRIGATAACVYTNTIPIFTFLTAIVLGQEHFTWRHLAGIVVVVIGATLAQLPPRRSERVSSNSHTLRS